MAIRLSTKKSGITIVENVNMSLKVTSKLNFPGITPTDVFGLLPTFVTWDSKVTSTQIQFSEHQSSENFKIVTWIHDPSHPC